MDRRATNSMWTNGIDFRGQHYAGPYALLRAETHDASVSPQAFAKRLQTRCRREGAINDAVIAECLVASEQSYKNVHRSRRTWVICDGRRVDVRSLYAEVAAPSAIYPTFRRRVLRLQQLELLSHASLTDAATLPQRRWVPLYGGGRRQPFRYHGELWPELDGHLFPSIASFLLRVGRYPARGLVWDRLHAGWAIDSALDEPAVPLSDRCGLIYVVIRNSTGQRYVGLTVVGCQARWRQHVVTAPDRTTLLARAIREDGPGGFEVVILEQEVEQTALASRERHWIERLGTLAPGGTESMRRRAVGRRSAGIRPCLRGRITHQGQRLRPSWPSRTASRRMWSPKGLQRASHCRKARQHSKHFAAGTPLWRRWKSLLRRHPAMVAQRWHDYDCFASDVDAGYRLHLHLVRRDDSRLWDGDNFDWVVVDEKMRRQGGKPITIGGRHFRTLTSAAAAYGMPVSTLKYRLRSMSPVEAVRAGFTGLAPDDSGAPPGSGLTRQVRRAMMTIVGSVVGVSPLGVPIDEEMRFHRFGSGRPDAGKANRNRWLRAALGAAFAMRRSGVRSSSSHPFCCTRNPRLAMLPTIVGTNVGHRLRAQPRAQVSLLPAVSPFHAAVVAAALLIQHNRPTIPAGHCCAIDATLRRAGPEFGSMARKRPSSDIHSCRHVGANDGG